MENGVVLLPAGFLGGALAQVFGAEIAQRLRDRVGVVRGLYLKTSARLAAVAVVICFAIFLLSPQIMPWLLGDLWTQSATLAQAMAISASAGLIVSPLSQVYTVYQSPISLVVDASRILLVGGAAGIAHSLQMGPLGTTWLLYAGQLINYLITWILGLRIATEGERNEKTAKDS